MLFIIRNDMTFNYRATLKVNASEFQPNGNNKRYEEKQIYEFEAESDRKAKKMIEERKNEITRRLIDATITLEGRILKGTFI